MLKSSLDCLLPVITEVINRSIASSTFPSKFKTASVTPLLKKPDLEADELRNYRPVSNLPYLGKITEKMVVKQLKNHMSKHNLNQPAQSAYRENHSTETAIVKIVNDMLRSLDKGQCVLLVLLDLSAAFDTIDHELLLHRFETCFGIQSEAKEWLKSYFSNRQQVVRIEGVNSDPKNLETGIPQGSVIGPFSFPRYTSPLFKLVQNHKCSIHMYADDTQLYMSFKHEDSEDTLTRMEACIADIRCWMSRNFLKLNDGKTEFLVISKKSMSDQAAQVGSITIGLESIPAAPKARNIGCFIDATLCMEAQINNMTKSCCARLHQIGRIRQYLTEDAAAMMVNAQRTSRLDNFNAVLVGLSDELLNKLQLVQNNAAKMVTQTKKYDHVTPLLYKLHWLPIQYRIDYKIILLCFKALNNLAPVYISELLEYKKPTGYNLRNEFELFEPRTNLVTYGDRAFSSIAPKLWNKLPLYLKSITKLDKFKTELKTFLFKKAFKCNS